MSDPLLHVLKDWRTLNANIKGLREEQLKALLDYEQAGQGRMAIMERLHQRYSALRNSRERLELMMGGKLL